MLSIPHEALVTLFEKRLALAPELLRDVLRVPVPAWTTVERVSGELTQFTPAEYRADLVLLVEDGTRRLAIVVEVQLRPDAQKRRSWPVYLTTVRARHDCDAVLLVVAPSSSVAEWARSHIDIGHPRFRLEPLVVSPEVIPAVTTMEAARASPELAVLSAMAHGKGEVDRAIAVGTAAVEASRSLDDDLSRLYADLILDHLGPIARKAVEALMIPKNYEYQSDFARKYYGQGKAEGKAEALLDLLEARELVASDEQRRRILEETDQARVQVWFKRALKAASVADVLADEAS